MLGNITRSIRSPNTRRKQLNEERMEQDMTRAEVLDGTRDIDPGLIIMHYFPYLKLFFGARARFECYIVNRCQRCVNSDRAMGVHNKVKQTRHTLLPLFISNLHRKQKVSLVRQIIMIFSPSIRLERRRLSLPRPRTYFSTLVEAYKEFRQKRLVEHRLYILKTTIQQNSIANRLRSLGGINSLSSKKPTMYVLTGPLGQTNTSKLLCEENSGETPEFTSSRPCLYVLKYLLSTSCNEADRTQALIPQTASTSSSNNVVSK